MRPVACTLALTLLSEHDQCPACGWPASDHGGWQRELARGALPHPPAPTVERGAGCIPGCNDRYPCVMDDTCPGSAVDRPAPKFDPCSCGEPGVGTGADGETICAWCRDNEEGKLCKCGADPDPAGTGPDGEPMCARCRYLGTPCVLCNDSGWTGAGFSERNVCPKCPVGEQVCEEMATPTKRTLSGTVLRRAVTIGVKNSGPVAEPIRIETTEQLRELFGGGYGDGTRDAAKDWMAMGMAIEPIEVGMRTELDPPTGRVRRFRNPSPAATQTAPVSGSLEWLALRHAAEMKTAAEELAESGPEPSEADAPSPEASAPAPQGIPDQRPLQSPPGAAAEVSQGGDNPKPLSSTSSLTRVTDAPVLLVVVDGQLLGELDDFELRIERPTGKRPYARVVLEVCAELDEAARLLEQWHEWTHDG